MIPKMFSIMDITCKKANDTLGISIKFPRPNKRMLKSSQFLNVSTGIALVVAGILSPYKWAVLLGGLSFASIAFTQTQ